MAFLVQREEFENEADELGIKVTDADVDTDVEEFLKTRFGGKRDAFEKALEGAGLHRRGVERHAPLRPCSPRSSSTP